MPGLVMIVDDDDNVRRLLASQIETLGHRTLIAASGDEALVLYAQQRPDLTLLDYNMPGSDGLQVLKRLKELDKSSKIVMVSGYGDSSVIVQAMKLGAENYLIPPVSIKELRVLVERLVVAVEGGEEVVDDEPMDGAIGRSEAMQVVFRLVRRVAPTQATVLIRGESGMGKEVIARAIHHHSRVALSRCLGTIRSIKPQTGCCNLHSGDGLLLCTDGLYASLDTERLVAVVFSLVEPRSIAEELVAAARSKAPPDQDNLTALVVHISLSA